MVVTITHALAGKDRLWPISTAAGMAKSRFLEDFIETNLESIPTEVHQNLHLMKSKEKVFEGKWER